MIHAAQTLLLAVCLTLTVGCCGPMWQHGSCAGGGVGGCSDGCGACDGCGELYVDPWINHPADRCDPCDSCGNYNGQSCGKCRPVFAGVKSLWGYRCDDGCGGACGGGCGGACDSGCDTGSCGGDCGCGSHHGEGEFMGGYANGQPTLALQEGETIVGSHMSGDPMPTHSSSMGNSYPTHVTQQGGTTSQIFRPRQVNQPRPLAY
ncbi:hypothetical protein CA85_00690 [Allorhodopirellula solitaria]|uniref:Uncharacterized protein n=2 Tax=Allorhodopirellula solitaria TaxID=2527987 RepID=A0A5C5YIT5_9BACT|nr:hypothetical protein CA85_00690 [Allorhodopirellula solitaria]